MQRLTLGPVLRYWLWWEVLDLGALHARIVVPITSLPRSFVRVHPVGQELRLLLIEAGEELVHFLGFVAHWLLSAQHVSRVKRTLLGTIPCSRVHLLETPFADPTELHESLLAKTLASPRQTSDPRAAALISHHVLQVLEDLQVSFEGSVEGTRQETVSKDKKITEVGLGTYLSFSNFVSW